MIKLIFADDEFLAVSNFMQTIADDVDVQCKHFWENPENALIYAEENEVNGAFLDISMPKIDGLTLAEKLISIRPNIKIVFVSAFPSNEELYRTRLGENYMGFCPKPYEKDTIYKYLSCIVTTIQKEQKVEIRTFGKFGLFVNGFPVDFKSRKAKEMMAYLVHRNGDFVEMDELICALWSDRPADLAKRLYRDACCCLRQILKEYSLELVDFRRARAAVIKDGVKCDYWQYVDGDESIKYDGEYLSDYAWSLPRQFSLSSH